MVKQTLFHILVHCKQTLDLGRLTWRHDSILNHIVGCLKSALVGKSTEYSCTVTLMDCRPHVAGQSRLTSWCRHRDRTLSSLISWCKVGIGVLVELTCPWDTDAKRAKECKTARYTDLKIALSNEGWDCSLNLIEVGARGHIIKGPPLVVISGLGPCGP
jgi:hypothetical protein